MKTYIKQYLYMGRNALNMLFAVCLALAGAVSFSACSSTDDPYFTVSENDDPRILNTDLSDKVIDRKTSLKIELKVTPIAYTTVTWLLDNVQIAEGITLDQQLPVGNHVLKIVATTTKGKSTYRTINVTVNPAEGDPVLAGDEKSRWLTVGTTKTIDCTNVTSVSKVIVGDQEATNVSYANNQITFDVPAMEAGEYMVFIEDAEGTRYACGLFIVSNEVYEEPAVQENVLWEGDFVVDWDGPEDHKEWREISQEQFASFELGHVLMISLKLVGEDYHKCQFDNWSWAGLPIPTPVIEFSEDTNVTIEITQELKDAVAEQAFCIHGHGFSVTKVVYK